MATGKIRMDRQVTVGLFQSSKDHGYSRVKGGRLASSNRIGHLQQRMQVA